MKALVMRVVLAELKMSLMYIIILLVSLFIKQIFSAYNLYLTREDFYVLRMLILFLENRDWNVIFIAKT